MASLTPLTVVELQEAVADVQSALDPAGEITRPERLRLLRSLHEALLRATRGTDVAPVASLEVAAAIVAGLPRLADTLSPRPRTVFRLLRSGAYDAAWQVLIDNGTGVVDEPYDASTATGTGRTSWRLPLLTRIDAGVVFAELPGFRDPRFAASDDCYDITDAVTLKAGLDEVLIVDGVLSIAGWAVLDVMMTDENEQPSLVLTGATGEARFVGRRLRRADLVTGRDGLTRRAWAGWAVDVPLDDPELVPGEWALSLEVDHDGLVRRCGLGDSVTDLATASTKGGHAVGQRTLRWNTSGDQWKLVVT